MRIRDTDIKYQEASQTLSCEVHKPLIAVNQNDAEEGLSGHSHLVLRIFLSTSAPWSQTQGRAKLWSDSGEWS